MTSRSPAQTTLRRVLASALIALVLGAAAVTALEVDQSLARRGSKLPEQAWTVTRWFAVGFGVLALGLWIVERRRSRARITVGVVIALAVVVATPIALAIAQPDNTAMTVVAFDARTGRRVWQRDVGLFYQAGPARRDSRDHVQLTGYAPSRRCEGRPMRVTLDRHDGKTISHKTIGDLPSQFGPAVPRTAGDIRLEIVRRAPQDAYATLQAHDASGRLLWSTPADDARLPPVLYADQAVVAIYVPGTGPDAPPSVSGSSAGWADTFVAVLDARTGTRRWTIHSNLFATPVFNRGAVFAIEGTRVVVHVKTTGAVVARYRLVPPVDDQNPDAHLEPTGQDAAVALVEGGGRHVTLLDRAGTVRWKATLPRAMPYPQVSPLDDTIYVSGGGSLGYQCGGE